MKCFELLSVWRVQTPLEEVWSVMIEPEQWPDWWPGLESVRELERGRADGVGNRHRFVWRSPLRFRLQIDMRATAVEPQRRLAALASGDAVGTGEWRFHARGEETWVEYRWRVQIVRPGMRHLATIAAPLFARSHRRLMRRGAHGLGRRLRCRVESEC